MNYRYYTSWNQFKKLLSWWVSIVSYPPHETILSSFILFFGLIVILADVFIVFLSTNYVVFLFYQFVSWCFDRIIKFFRFLFKIIINKISSYEDGDVLIYFFSQIPMWLYNPVFIFFTAPWGLFLFWMTLGSFFFVAAVSVIITLIIFVFLEITIFTFRCISYFLNLNQSITEPLWYPLEFFRYEELQKIEFFVNNSDEVLTKVFSESDLHRLLEYAKSSIRVDQITSDFILSLFNKGAQKSMWPSAQRKFSKLEIYCPAIIITLREQQSILLQTLINCFKFIWFTHFFQKDVPEYFKR